MITFPNSPRVLNGDIVLIGPETPPAQRVISLKCKLGYAHSHSEVETRVKI